MAAPPRTALDAFGATSDPVPLPGGQRTAWRAGSVVLKPLDMSATALAWQEEVLGSLDVRDVRVAPPLRSRAGDLVVAGWTAWPALDGVHAPRWDDVIDAGERLHEAFAGVPRPDRVLGPRRNRWASADRIAWDERDAGDAAAVPEVARLLEARRPVLEPAQLVHGDLTGNVLFHERLPPAIIDLSPYWRPVGFATAVVVADAVVWYGAGRALLRRVPDPQLLVRALLFRLLTHPDPATEAHRYRAAIAVVT